MLQDRGYVLWKFADLIEREAHDLAIVETLVSPPLFFKLHFLWDPIAH